MEQTPELLPHLFRSEFQKLVAVLTRFLGAGHIQTAEDIASDTFLKAAEIWAYNGLPDNPTAWLYIVAKNAAKNYLHRSATFAKTVLPNFLRDAELSQPPMEWSDEYITDSQLQMLFAICHPMLNEVSQIALSLRLLCGLSIDEIATALLTSRDAIAKRLSRAKQVLREEHIIIELPGELQIDARLDTVLHTIYLLFSEGYYSQSNDSIIRHDLCLEAMRLTQLLLQNERTTTPKTRALMALMCFHSSRFDARSDGNGHCILYNDQDETRWNTELIALGAYYLHEAAGADTVSKFHIEATIAYWHTRKEDTAEKWENILLLFNTLLQIEYSPIAALNRAFAISKVYGNEQAIAEAEALHLENNTLYHLLLGVLYQSVDSYKSITHLKKALLLSSSVMEKDSITSLLTRLY